MLATSSSLTWPDYAVLAIALGVLIAIGVAFSREQHDTVDFFLARRRVPWWAACLSFLATEISAVTIMSAMPTAVSFQGFQLCPDISLPSSARGPFTSPGRRAWTARPPGAHRSCSP